MKKCLLILSLLLLSTTQLIAATATEEEFSKFFHQMIKEEEQNLHHLLELRQKLFPKMAAHVPKVEMKDDPAAYEIKAEIPGIAREDIVVRVRGQDLSITGQRKNEFQRTSGSSTFTEFYYGDYERMIHLNERVDAKSLKVDYKDGIINIHLNKMKPREQKA